MTPAPKPPTHSPATTTTVTQWLSAQHDLDSADCTELVCMQLQVGRAALLSQPMRPLTQPELDKLEAAAEHLRQGVPVAYVVGSAGFWDMDLKVTPDVLIPRPDTECLVDLALAKLAAVGTADASNQQSGIRIVDLGTGSGAIALVLARQVITTPGSVDPLPLEVVATDASDAALAVARDNAARYPAAPTNSLTILRSHWLQDVPGKFDLILSNPPYIAAGDSHLPGLTHEPQQALVAGLDGLADLTHIAAAATAHLKPGGWLLLEHGYNQAPAVRELLLTNLFCNITTKQDLGGHDRVTSGQRGSTQLDSNAGRTQ